MMGGVVRISSSVAAVSIGVPTPTGRPDACSKIWTADAVDPGCDVAGGDQAFGLTGQLLEPIGVEFPATRVEPVAVGRRRDPTIELIAGQVARR